MKVHDEVCGMTIDAENAAATVELDGDTYYFCTERCSRKFREHPGWYVPLKKTESEPGDVIPERRP